MEQLDNGKWIGLGQWQPEQLGQPKGGLAVRFDQLLGDSWQMHFDRGDANGCPGGARRRAVAQLGCGPVEAVRELAESEACVYSLKFWTPQVGHRRFPILQCRNLRRTPL